MLDTLQNLSSLGVPCRSVGISLVFLESPPLLDRRVFGVEVPPAAVALGRLGCPGLAVGGRNFCLSVEKTIVPRGDPSAQCYLPTAP